MGYCNMYAHTAFTFHFNFHQITCDSKFTARLMLGCIVRIRSQPQAVLFNIREVHVQYLRMVKLSLSLNELWFSLLLFIGAAWKPLVIVIVIVKIDFIVHIMNERRIKIVHDALYQCETMHYEQGCFLCKIENFAQRKNGKFLSSKIIFYARFKLNSIH